MSWLNDYKTRKGEEEIMKEKCKYMIVVDPKRLPKTAKLLIKLSKRHIKATRKKKEGEKQCQAMKN